MWQLGAQSLALGAGARLFFRRSLHSDQIMILGCMRSRNTMSCASCKSRGTADGAERSARPPRDARADPNALSPFPRRSAQALLHTGESETVIFFAGVSRSREVYVLAANWLQSLAWHADAKLLKAIVDFYTKAKAFERE